MNLIKLKYPELIPNKYGTKYEITRKDLNKLLGKEIELKPGHVYDVDGKILNFKEIRLKVEIDDSQNSEIVFYFTDKYQTDETFTLHELKEKTITEKDYSSANTDASESSYVSLTDTGDIQAEHFYMIPVYIVDSTKSKSKSNTKSKTRKGGKPLNKSHKKKRKSIKTRR